MADEPYVDTAAAVWSSSATSDPFAGDVIGMGNGGMRNSVQMTRYGGECYAFAMLASGQIDLCLELALQPYDIVALIPIIERAGAVTRNSMKRCVVAEAGAFRWRRRQSGGDDFLRQKRDA
ncbi:fructose-1,6-bisphosphatase/inositol monophosphatase family enzyme (plasmid) [Ensifer sp. WSM1721]